MPESEKVYLVLPGCDDTNRGDQALIWETVSLAKEAGFDGRYLCLPTLTRANSQRLSVLAVSTLFCRTPLLISKRITTSATVRHSSSNGLLYLSLTV